MNETHFAGCRSFIGAIIAQAYQDAIGHEKGQRISALYFIDPSNEWFAFYCHLLGFDPEYVAWKLRQRIARETKHRRL